jgi:aminopeptidase
METYVLLVFRCSYAEAQNWARELCETPANLLTPTIFCKVVMAKLSAFKNVSAIAHDEEWAKAKGMGSFLSVTQGTDEPAKMLEIHYKGAGSDKPTLGLVGKGITFDTGGYALKGALGMKVGHTKKMSLCFTAKFLLPPSTANAK